SADGDDCMPFPAAREPPGCREIGSVERVRAPRREPLKSGRNDLIGWGVAERRRKRTTVKRVADGTPQVDIAEKRSSRVEDDCVDDRRLVWVVLLLRSEEHTSELQSLAYLVCRLL